MNARHNPFATARVLRIRYALTDDDWTSLLGRLSQLQYRAAIVGPHGTGKTTLLEDLQDRLIARGMPIVALRRDTTQPHFSRAELDAHLTAMTPDHLVCLDGAEQLTRVGWAYFQHRTRRARGLIITSHRPGLLPTLHTCATDPRLLEEIVGRLLAPASAVHAASLPAPDDLFVRHAGNLREALRELYDVCAGLPA